MSNLYRVFETKEEWDRQARILIWFGFFCGAVIALSSLGFVWLVTAI